MVEKQYQLHEQRVLDEAKELSEKIEKLKIFINSQVDKTAKVLIPEEDLQILMMQQNTMQSYLAILLFRISKF